MLYVFFSTTRYEQLRVELRARRGAIYGRLQKEALRGLYTFYLLYFSFVFHIICPLNCSKLTFHRCKLWQIQPINVIAPKGNPFRWISFCMSLGTFLSTESTVNVYSGRWWNLYITSHILCRPPWPNIPFLVSLADSNARSRTLTGIRNDGQLTSPPWYGAWITCVWTEFLHYLLKVPTEDRHNFLTFGKWELVGVPSLVTFD